MDTLSLLDPLLYRFRDLFGSQNFLLFCAYVWGVILCRDRHTVTGIYQASAAQCQYWSFPKFLSRGKWNWELVCQRLIWIVLFYLPNYVYVYDHTHAIKTGKKQFGLHFFHNHRYQKRNTNQSKFHWGHEFAGLGILGLTEIGALLFPVWAHLLLPGAESALSAFQGAIALVPPGLILFDRGFNNRKYFLLLLDRGHHLLCRARKNAAFFYPAAPSKGKRRGRPKVYGKRVDFRKWRYQEVAIKALDETRWAASHIVRTRMCPQPVKLVVVRTLPKKGKGYRYFLVYTTDLELSVETILFYYRLRWTFETGVHDSKESFGFDHYQVRSQTSIQRSVILSFLAASLTQLLALPAFQQGHPSGLPALPVGLKEMNIHWYHPKRWTLGLIARYLRWQQARKPFSASFPAEQNPCKIQNPASTAAD